MQRVVLATALIGLALAGPAAAQGPNVQQFLQGLTTGNQGQDQALRDAFERGYQRGRQDEARQHRSDTQGSYRREPDERDNGSYRDQPGRDPSYERRGGSSDR